MYIDYLDELEKHGADEESIITTAFYARELDICDKLFYSLQGRAEMQNPGFLNIFQKLLTKNTK